VLGEMSFRPYQGSLSFWHLAIISQIVCESILIILTSREPVVLVRFVSGHAFRRAVSAAL